MHCAFHNPKLAVLIDAMDVLHSERLKYPEVKELPMARPDGVTVVNVQIRLKRAAQ
jgi:hypothetical protein